MIYRIKFFLIATIFLLVPIFLIAQEVQELSYKIEGDKIRVIQNVYKASVVNNKPQTPSINVGSGIQDSWEEIILK